MSLFLFVLFSLLTTVLGLDCHSSLPFLLTNSSFQNYTSCSRITNDVYVYGDVDQQLPLLTNITGSVFLVPVLDAHNFTLISTRSLDFVQEIGGDLVLGIDNHLKPHWLRTKLRDDFYEGFPNLRTIGGSLFVSLPVSQLWAFYNLTLVNGTIDIRNTHLLQEFEGFTNLVSIGGNLTLINLVNLQHIDNFMNVEHIPGRLMLSGLFHLTNLDGLISLRSVGSDVLIRTCESLTSLAALASLTSVGGGLALNHLPSLTSLAGLNINTLSFLEIADVGHVDSLSVFAGLTTVGFLYLSLGSAVTSLEGLHNLETISGRALIRGNDGIVNLRGLRKLSHIFGPLTLSNNNALEQISDLSALTRVEGGITLASNYILTSLRGLQNLQYLGPHLLLSVMPMLNDTSALGNLFLLHQHILRDLYLTYLPRVTSLATTFRGLTELRRAGGVNGSESNGLAIARVGIYNMSGFEDLSWIDLRLSLDTNPNLGNLDALSALTVCSFGFSLYDMPRLTSISGLLNLDPYSMWFPDIILEKLPVVQSYEAVNRLIKIRYLRMKEVNVTSMVQFKDVTVFEELHLLGMPLETLTGLEHLSNLRIFEMVNSPNLTSIEGLRNLTQVDEFTMSSTSVLTSLNGLQSLGRITSRLYVQDNHALRSLDGLRNLHGSLAAGMDVSGNPLFVNIDALSGITRSGPLRVSNNANMTNIQGLSGITRVVGLLTLSDNPMFRVATGLCQMEEIDTAFVSNNPMLCCDSMTKIFTTIQAPRVSLSGCADLVNCSAANNFTCKCSDRSCRNGGLCRDLLNGALCLCVQGYVGSACQIAVPQIVSCTPSVALTRIGSFNQSFTLLVRRLPFPFVLKVEETYVEVVNYQELASLTVQNPPGPFNVTFRAGFTTPGYKPISVEPIGDSHALSKTSANSLLYITNNPCVSQGSFYYQGVCGACPEGGFCPGGDRVWPHAGYWSPDEHSPPTQCRLREACPGSLGETPGYGVPDPLSSGARPTNLCAFNQGYEGAFCGSCIAGSWYQTGAGTCESCGFDESDAREIAGLLSVVAIFFLVIGLGVAALKDSWLFSLVTALILLQQFIVIGATASSQVSDSGFRAFWQSLSFFNFDVRFIKPGCSVPRISYIAGFWYTILIFIVAGILFFIASVIRAFTLSDEAIAKSGVDRPKLAKRRTVHSSVILGCIIYLQFTLRCLQGLSCVDVGGELRLRDDLGTKCYEGAHLATALFLWIFLFVFVIGFPAWAVYIVRRTAQKHGLHDDKRAQKYGYLYRGTKDEYYWFRLLNFVTCFGVALQSNYSKQVSAQTFGASLFFFINIGAVGILEPFLHWWTNTFNFIAGVLALIGTLVYLALMDRELSERHWDYFAAGLVLLLLGLTIVGILQFVKRRRPERWNSMRQRLQRALRMRTGESDEGDAGTLPPVSLDDEKKVPFDRISSNAPPPVPDIGRAPHRSSAGRKEVKSRESGEYVLDLNRPCDECETSTAALRCESCAQSLCDSCSDNLHRSGKRSTHALKRFSQQGAQSQRSAASRKSPEGEENTTETAD